MQIKVELKGKLNSNISLRVPLTQAALIITNEAKTLAPYQTWTLQSSLGERIVTDSMMITGSKLEYAGIREMYNRKNPHTRRYMARGLEKWLPQIQKLISEHVANNLIQ